MSIISVRENENNRRKRKGKSVDKIKKGVGQATVKVWELNDFVVCSNEVLSK